MESNNEVIESDDFTVDNRTLRKLGKGFDKVRVLVIEGFVPPRKYVREQEPLLPLYTQLRAVAPQLVEGGQHQFALAD